MDSNRDDKRIWHRRLPPPNPRATRTVLTYLEYVGTGEEPVARGAPVDADLPEGCEYNRNGELQGWA